MKVNLVKPDNLLSILNQVNNEIEFTMKESQIKLPSFVITINKTLKKI